MMQDQEEQQQQDNGQQQDAADGAVRFPAWTALAILSVVAWAALLGRKHNMDSSEKWAFAVTTLSWILAVIGWLCYLKARGVFMNQPPEVMLAALLIAIWCAGLPVIMNPANSIAVGYTTVTNANLYFASWGAFACVLWICGSLAKLLYGVDLVAQATPIVKSRKGKWFALVASSIIVMGASIRVFKAFDCTLEVMKKAPTCKQTKFSISAGVIGTCASVLNTLFQANFGVVREHEWAGSIVMLIIWSFGLGFVTFGEGPGHSIGNLYFATWASFVLSILLFAENYQEYLAAKEQAANPTSTEEVPEPMDDVPIVEDEEDDV